MFQEQPTLWRNRGYRHLSCLRGVFSQGPRNPLTQLHSQTVFQQPLNVAKRLVTERMLSTTLARYNRNKFKMMRKSTVSTQASNVVFITTIRCLCCAVRHSCKQLDTGDIHICQHYHEHPGNALASKCYGLKLLGNLFQLCYNLWGHYHIGRLLLTKTVCVYTCIAYI